MSGFEFLSYSICFPRYLTNLHGNNHILMIDRYNCYINNSRMSRRLISDSADLESARIVAILIIFVVSLGGFLLPIFLPALRRDIIGNGNWLLIKV